MAAVVVAPVLVLLLAGYPVGALIALGLGLQAVVAAGRWPEVSTAIRDIAFRHIPAMIGLLVLAVALDWGVGAAWDRITDPTATVEATDLVNADLPEPTDPRRQAPAYRGDAWVERYFAEFESMTYTYVPFIGPRVESVHGRYINSAEGIRRSYAPQGVDGDEAVEIWFFGGSTTFGEGQRDLHTVPSEVVRLAEHEGVTIRAVNYGERGYTAFQEFLLLEQELASRPAPDLVVFFDGHNEAGVRAENETPPDNQPAVFQQDVVAEAFDRAPAQPGQVAAPEPSIWADYVATSVASKIWRLVGEAAAQPAGAQPGPVFDPATADETRDVFSVYSRAVDLAGSVADRHGVVPEFFWQPAPDDNNAGPLLDLSALLPPTVHDIRDAFDGYADDAIFIDGGHTNELGAHLVAVAIWAELREALR